MPFVEEAAFASAFTSDLPEVLEVAGTDVLVGLMYVVIILTVRGMSFAGGGTAVAVVEADDLLRPVPELDADKDSEEVAVPVPVPVPVRVPVPVPVVAVPVAGVCPKVCVALHAMRWLASIVLVTEYTDN